MILSPVTFSTVEVPSWGLYFRLAGKEGLKKQLNEGSDQLHEEKRTHDLRSAVAS